MDASAFASLPPETLRAVLPAFLAGHIADPEAAAAARAMAEQVVGGWSEPIVRRIAGRLTNVASEITVWEADPDGRALARRFIGDLVDGRVVGVEHLLDARAAGPVVLVSNHLSYVDTTVTELMLAREGHRDLAEALVAAAGPKVYQDLFRRVAAICLHTLPVPQSSSLGHTERVPARELLSWAQTSLDEAARATAAGRMLIVYAEGSRTRTGHMRPFLKGVHRWLGLAPGLRVVPTGLVGTEALMPLGEERLHPTRCEVRFGPAIEVGPLGTKDALAAAWHAVAALLPPHLAPEPGTEAVAGGGGTGAG